jgi:hypothetical protein
MPIHDWARVDPGIFHHFHTAWITHISDALNDGLLPGGYYALVEQVKSDADLYAKKASPFNMSLFSITYTLTVNYSVFL